MDSKYKSFILTLPLLFSLAVLQPDVFRLTDSLGIVSHRQTEVSWKPRIVSFDPLIIYVQDFLSPSERHGIANYAKKKLARSTQLHRNGSVIVSEKRTSSSAMVPRNQTDLAGVLQRYAAFQGFLNTDMIENVQVTHYEEGQQFQPHYDYLRSKNDSFRFRRATTGFAILDAHCEHCGTHFPLIDTNWTGASQQWCEIVDCASSTLIVNPSPGGLLFWQNVRSDGLLDKRMLHAGLPLSNGFKTGLNIWTDINLWDSPVRRSEEIQDF